jgi:hypothetical protein
MKSVAVHQIQSLGERPISLTLYATFTEGFDTPDLIEAKPLLHER